jgi:hypothetical protein
VVGKFIQEGLDSLMGILSFSVFRVLIVFFCSFTTGETVVLYKLKGKLQGGSEVHLPGMTQLTGKSSCQTFMLKLLKVIIDLRGTARTSLRSKAGKSGG